MQELTKQNRIKYVYCVALVAVTVLTAPRCKVATDEVLVDVVLILAIRLGALGTILAPPAVHPWRSKGQVHSLSMESTQAYGSDHPMLLTNDITIVLMINFAREVVQPLHVAFVPVSFARAAVVLADCILVIAVLVAKAACFLKRLFKSVSCLLQSAVALARAPKIRTRASSFMMWCDEK